LLNNAHFGDVRRGRSRHLRTTRRRNPALAPHRLEPDVTLESAAAYGNKYWLGKLNLTMALAKREVRSKGQVAKILKLVPLTKPLFASYEALLREKERKDLLDEAGVK